MANKWLDTTQVVAGAIIAHNYDPVPDEHVMRIPVNQVRPEIFYPPYDCLIKDIQKGKPVEEVVQNQLSTYQSSLTAVRNVNGSSEGVDWVIMLEKSSAEYKAGEELDRLAKKLLRGQDIDWTKVNEIAAIAQAEHHVDAYTPLSEIKRSSLPFTKTGVEFIDFHLGGIPEVGLTTVLGTPGAGKTTLADIIAARFATVHPEKIVAFHTMEMLAEEQARRFDEIMKLPKDVQDRIYVRDLSETPEHVLAKASTIENLGLIVVDFAEYLVPGEITEGAMSHVFQCLATGAKNLRVPLILLAQVSKSSYKGGIPKPNDVYYTAAAEKFSWMFLSVYNPNISKHYDDPDREKMMIRPGEAAVVCWKSRGGFRVHKDDSPGGVVVQWNGKLGWRWDKPGLWRQYK